MKKLSIYVIVLLVTLIPVSNLAQSTDTTWPTFLQHSGDVIQIGLPAGIVLENLINKDKEGFKQFSLSFGTNFLATHALKRIIRKKRPDPSEARNALPSGHTSASFQAATYIHIRYGIKYGIPAYALATYVGYSRIDGVDRRHDVWDVVAGAALGSLTSYLFVTSKDKDVKISPVLTSDSVSFSLTFDIK
jgi:membrane-associated phospholipid phosphatase